MKTHLRSINELIFTGSNPDCCRIAATPFTIVLLMLGLVLISAETVFPCELAGATVTPHMGTPGVRFWRPPLAPLKLAVLRRALESDSKEVNTWK